MNNINYKKVNKYNSYCLDNIVFLIFSIFFFIINTSASPSYQPYEINAHTIEYGKNNFIATGGVTGKFNNIILNADSIFGDTNTGELTISNNISLKQGSLTWLSDYIDFNYIINTGLLQNVDVNIINKRLSAESVNVVSSNNYLISSSSLTTCPWTNPCHNIFIKKSSLSDNGIIHGKNVFFNFKNIPIFYLPYWKYNTNNEYSDIDINIGKKNNLGAYIRYNSLYHFSNNLKYGGSLIYYDKRGIGLSPKLFINNDDLNINFDAFYINDNDPYRRYNSPNQINEISSDRLKIRLKANRRFSNKNYIDSKFLYFSDKYLNEEYFRNEYLDEVQPENQISWVYGNELIGSEVYISTRLNDFYSNLNRIDLIANIHRKRITNTPLYYQNKIMLSKLDYRSNSLLNSSDDLIRFYNNHKIFLPSKIGKVNFIPKVEVGYSHYSSSINSSKIDRLYKIVGFESSVQANKIIHKESKWYGDGLRHIVKPYINYEYSDFSSSTNLIFQHDQIDILNDNNNIKIGLNQLFQTKRIKKNSRLAEIDLYTNYSFDKPDSENSFGNIYADARCSITDSLFIDYLASLDVDGGKSPYTMTRLSYENKSVNTYLSHLNLYDKALLATQIEFYPRKDLMIDSYIRFNQNSRDIEQASITAYISDECFQYGIGYRLSARSAHQVIFSLRMMSF